MASMLALGGGVAVAAFLVRAACCIPSSLLEPTEPNDEPRANMPFFPGTRRTCRMEAIARWCRRYGQGFLQGRLRVSDDEAGGILDPFSQVRQIDFCGWKGGRGGNTESHKLTTTQRACRDKRQGPKSTPNSYAAQPPR